MPDEEAEIPSKEFAPEEATPKTVRVRAMCGQSVAGRGVLRALSIYELENTSEVQARISADYLKIVDVATKR